MKYAGLRKRGVTSKSWTTSTGVERHGNLVTKGLVYKIFSNPVYIGIAAYKGQHYPGEHVGIIDRALWDTVQTQLKNGTPMSKARLAGRGGVPSLLRGLLFSGIFQASCRLIVCIQAAFLSSTGCSFRMRSLPTC